MDFQLRIVHQAPRKYTAHDFLDLHKLLPVFPLGYQEYITQFGWGFVGGELYILPPDLIVSDGDFGHTACRKSRDDYWRWDNDAFTKEYVLACVTIAGNDRGDRFLVHPLRPDQVIFLQREEHIYAMKGAGIPGILTSYREGYAGEEDHHLWFEFDGR